MILSFNNAFLKAETSKCNVTRSDINLNCMFVQLIIFTVLSILATRICLTHRKISYQLTFVTTHFSFNLLIFVQCTIVKELTQHRWVLIRNNTQRAIYQMNHVSVCLNRVSCVCSKLIGIIQLFTTQAYYFNYKK